MAGSAATLSGKRLHGPGGFHRRGLKCLHVGSGTSSRRRHHRRRPSRPSGRRGSAGTPRPPPLAVAGGGRGLPAAQGRPSLRRTGRRRVRSVGGGAAEARGPRQGRRTPHAGPARLPFDLRPQRRRHDDPPARVPRDAAVDRRGLGRRAPRPRPTRPASSPPPRAPNGTTSSTRRSRASTRSTATSCSFAGSSSAPPRKSRRCSTSRPAPPPCATGAPSNGCAPNSPTRSSPTSRRSDGGQPSGQPARRRPLPADAAHGATRGPRGGPPQGIA